MGPDERPSRRRALITAALAMALAWPAAARADKSFIPIPEIPIIP